MRSALSSLKAKSQVVLNSPSLFAEYNEFLETHNFDTCFSNYKILFTVDSFANIKEACEIFTQFWDSCSEFVRELQLVIPWTCAFSMLKCMCCAKPNQAPVICLQSFSLTLEDIDNGNNEWAQDNSQDSMNVDNRFGDPNLEEVVSGAQVSLRSLVSFQLTVSIVLTSDKKVFPFSWNEFINSCPNLNHLCIQSDYASGHFYRIVNALLDRKMCLKTLKIGTRLPAFSSAFIFL